MKWAVLLMAVGVFGGRAALDAAERPNIIIIVCDDMGFSDIGCFGSEIATPNLDKLAAKGLRFTDFHNNAKCSETRASILTGLWHQQTQNLKIPNHVTLAEAIKPAGYATMMSGKWHVAGEPPDRGFERYFGFLSGAINFFTGLDWQAGTNLMRIDKEEYRAPKDFYSTDAFTDYAIEFMDEALEVDKDRPFFLYLTHNAPHFPLHALPEDIAKYKGKYSEGWDVIRQRRYARLKELGIIDETWQLSDRDSKVDAWNDTSASEKAFLEPMMEVYAAMVDRLDQNIGRLVVHLKEIKELDNTLILFFSDNGACPYQRLRTDALTPGPVDSDIAYDARWANMCNTPLRLYKQYAHEGGSATPMIAHWPNGIKARGELTGYTAHLVDLMPTLMELSGAKYPAVYGGKKILPMEGASLVPAFNGSKIRDGEKPIFWEYSGNHAIRDGKWKLVAERGKAWELYDLSKDRSETNNLAGKLPRRVKQMAARYDAWAKRTGAKIHEKSKKLKPSTQSQLFDLDEILKGK
jgi:arylsulfatase